MSDLFIEQMKKKISQQNQSSVFLVPSFFFDDPHLLTIMSAPFSPIIMTGAFVLAPTIVGMIDASMTRKFRTPWTLSSESTTDIESVFVPILQVPTEW